MNPDSREGAGKKAGLPLHQQLFVVLRDQILLGMYPQRGKAWRTVQGVADYSAPGGQRS